jgi:transposase InsO family protein
MARTVTSMKVISAVLAVAEGHSLNVAAICRDAGVSRKTFYKWLARYRSGGLAATEARSRRPHTSPRQTPIEVEERVVLLRKELADAGLDHGATTIQWHLGRERVKPVPSVATIHRVLVRRGLVVAQPRKRPKSSWHRFEAGAPNECWQIDHTEWSIATGVVKVFNIIDDHSRLAVRARVVEAATGEQAWATFCQAAQQWGLPAGTLSDNGLCFSGKLHHVEVLFEANLREAGIRPITGRGHHPQTTGKVERFQQTEKQWLRRQPLAGDIDELQAQLDRFCSIYNFERPHQGIGRATPISRWQANPPATPATQPLPHPHRSPDSRIRNVIVNRHGNVEVSPYVINVGSPWIGHLATVITDHNHATIFIAGQIVRHLTLDHTRRYQPSRRRRGGPRQPRQLPS